MHAGLVSGVMVSKKLNYVAYMSSRVLHLVLMVEGERERGLGGGGGREINDMV